MRLWLASRPLRVPLLNPPTLPLMASLSHFLKIEVQLVYYFGLVSVIQQSDSLIHTYLFFFRLFSLIGYYKTLSTVSCAMQQVTVGYLYLYREVCVCQGFPGGGKGSICQCRRSRDLGSIFGSVRSLGEGNGNPLQHSCLENSMDRRA